MKSNIISFIFHFELISAWKLPVAGKTHGVLSKVFRASVVLEVMEFGLQIQGLTDSIEMLLSKSCAELMAINACLVS